MWLSCQGIWLLSKLDLRGPVSRYSTDHGKPWAMICMSIFRIGLVPSSQLMVSIWPFLGSVVPSVVLSMVGTLFLSLFGCFTLGPKIANHRPLPSPPSWAIFWVLDSSYIGGSNAMQRCDTTCCIYSMVLTGSQGIYGMTYWSFLDATSYLTLS